MPFDPKFVRSLEYLNLLARKVLSGDTRAERRSPRRGASIEFAEHRRYVPGDEIRYIDWNVYARHGSLFVKEFSAEENVHVSILLDASHSMAFGTPRKFEAAKELAAALGYIGLVNFDSVSVYAFSDELVELKKFLRGKNQVFGLLDGLDKVEAKGPSDFRRAFSAALPRLKGRSLVLILTDFYDLAGYPDGIKSLLAQKFQVNLIHLVAREESDPPARGRYYLIDLETGREKDVQILPATVAEYRKRFDAFCAEVERYARGRELSYARVHSDDSLEKRILDLFRAGGILERR